MSHFDYCTEYLLFPSFEWLTYSDFAIDININPLYHQLSIIRHFCDGTSTLTAILVRRVQVAQAKVRALNFDL